MAVRIAFDVFRKTGTLPVEWVTAQRVHDSWRKAALTPLKLQAVRRMALKEGLEWKDPRPTATPKEKHPKARTENKGHRHMNEKAQRESHVQKQLAKMPKLIKTYREAVLARKATKFKPISLMFTGKINRIRQLTNKERYKQIQREKKARQEDD